MKQIHANSKFDLAVQKVVSIIYEKIKEELPPEKLTDLLKKIISITSQNQAGQEAFSNDETKEFLLAILNNQSSDDNLREQAARVIVNIAYISQAGQKTFSDNDTKQALLAAMHHQDSSDKLKEHVAEAIANITYDNQLGQETFADNDAKQALLAAIKNQGSRQLKLD